ncbi:MAG: hypothetical protein ABL961_10670 [Vicinamibacterales bacterium]
MSKTLLTVALSTALLVAACAVEKSVNPLSPSVAGPIAGVDISAPQTVEPSNGQRISADRQPLTLTIRNASTSGVRALFYRFEIAADSGFSNVIFTREGVENSGSGQTSLRLDAALAPERGYYWRARAEDGANVGPYTSGSFVVFSPLSLGAPTLVSPIANTLVSTRRPTATLQNAPRTGEGGQVSYLIEASESPAFSVSWSATFPEMGGLQTTVTPQEDLPADRQIFWRVRAFASDPQTVGPWSETAVFRTPAAAPAPPSGGGGGGGSAPSPNDELDLRSVTVLKGPSDIYNWAVGSRMTRVSQGGGELCTWHDQLGRWPAVIFFDDPNTLVEGNQWVFAKIGGKWYGGAADWYRPGQACKGVDAYSVGRDSFDQEPLHSWVPRPGEVFAVMSTTPARAWPAMRTLDHRTNTVMMTWQ